MFNIFDKFEIKSIKIKSKFRRKKSKKRKNSNKFQTEDHSNENSLQNDPNFRNSGEYCFFFKVLVRF